MEIVHYAVYTDGMVVWYSKVQLEKGKADEANRGLKNFHNFYNLYVMQACNLTLVFRNFFDHV